MFDGLGSGLFLVLPALAFGAILVAEVRSPRLVQPENPLLKWISNTGVFFLNTSLLAFLAQLFTLMLGQLNIRGIIPSLSGGIDRPWFEIIQFVGLIVLDLVLYGLHRLYHVVPILWRFHAVHHSDSSVDATTAVRHHPAEYITNAFLVTVVAAAIGLTPSVVGIYSSLLLTLQFFQHGNIRISMRLNQALCPFIVTPDLHRIHHSVAIQEGNTNYGAVLSIWDRLCHTYSEPSRQRDSTILFGVKGMEDRRYQRLDWMLFSPILPEARTPSGPEE